MKGQSSLEFVSIVGIALIIATPFVLEAQSTIIEINQGSDSAEFQASLDQLAKAVREVDAMGEPSKKTVEIQIKKDMDDFRVSEDRAIIFTQEISGDKTNYTRIFDTEINAQNIPTQQGIYDIEVEAWRGQVNISRQS